MIPSYIQQIPNCSEKGTFFALDLGGTNLRVCEVTLLGDKKWTMKQQNFPVLQPAFSAGALISWTKPSRPHLKNPRKLACEKVSLASLRERRQQRTDGALPSPDDFRNVPRRVTRNVLLHLVDSQVLFKGYSSTALNRHYGLDTAVMSALEAYTVPNSKESGDPIFTIGDVITSHLGIALLLVEDADALAAARVSEIVGTLGCRLSACAIAATRVILGLDGLIFGFYPRFEERVRTALKELLGGDVEKRGAIVMAEDGSGVGAALCAQAAMAMEQKGATVVS
ncbi:hypothetical protein JCM1841_005726 [Sporobolomyces salmonicolor]